MDCLAVDLEFPASPAVVVLADPLQLQEARHNSGYLAVGRAFQVLQVVVVLVALLQLQELRHNLDYLAADLVLPLVVVPEFLLQQLNLEDQADQVDQAVVLEFPEHYHTVSELQVVVQAFERNTVEEECQAAELSWHTVDCRLLVVD